MKKNILYIVIGLLVVSGGVGYFMWSQSSGIDTEPEKDLSAEDVTFPEDLEVGESTEQNGYTIERLPDATDGTSVIKPDLNREIPSRPESVTEEAYAQIILNMNTTANAIKEADNFNAWLNLASYRTMLGDYKGSEEIYIYLTKKYSPAWQVHANLGNLYFTYLVDLKKSAMNYRTSIDLLPSNPALYRSLFEVYMKDGLQTEAVAVLQEGIAHEPKAIDLYVLLARHYRDTNKGAEAKTYYNRAIEQARAVDNTSLVIQLEAERDSF